MYSMDDLRPQNALKGYTDIALDYRSRIEDKVYFSVCKRKSLQLYSYSETFDLGLEDELEISPLILCQFGSKICFADSSHYFLYDINTKKLIQLFPYKLEHGKPCIKLIDEKQFLLVLSSDGSTWLGAFISLQGEAQRGMITWKSCPLALAFQSPYIVSLQRDCIQIHSVLDQIEHQIIPLPMDNPNFLEEAEEGKVLISCGNIFFVLIPNPIEEQVLDCLYSRWNLCYEKNKLKKQYAWQNLLSLKQGANRLLIMYGIF